MQLDVSAALKERMAVFQIAHNWEEKDFVLPSEYVFLRPISVNGSYLFDGKQILLQADISTVLSVVCSRCLEPLEYALDIQANVVFSKTPDEYEGELLFEEEHIILDDFIKNEISLHLPFRFLCKQDCKGLCPVCGVNKNVSECMCGGELRPGNPFEKLKDLF